MNQFIPNLVVEVTRACNKACTGCYAPNIVVPKNADTKTLSDNYSGIFLGLNQLNDALTHLTEAPGIVAVRGGEPSLHPKLNVILAMLSHNADKVFLETHGRWLLKNERGNHGHLINEIIKTKTIVKISFDSMHGMKSSELKEITDYLEELRIDFRIAITEATFESYLNSRENCNWIHSENIIFQLKGSTQDELIRPSIGVINIEGKLSRTLTNKFITESINLLDLAL